ncbi:acetolactate synthase, small subunit [Clostridium pasteurianum DSM 525 = ATCC 6013]|uniref:Acetolactate synthase small subunit n=1 Tax=Clostridium pasteurianum DSM 525 = ATCC 6013 TaxID=1262449 RepID=A0A0H3J6B7_CLOPA|nr:acetolactate synthase small subunit [Clostridium pasteurianum]AJA49004.1 acetolactate synthase, small subunit [Clostridium pasteurianum DSM 525 = ATCC 6013]AJA52992.1 acetolactate synthase, small subunit [Clostridium pasteurianum DSM 525 = ATCC 6013]AOZ76210.1 acetolactate synthase [Clostridium pasteurianum DSM 525 = ATCC 6013]AOZ80006.1 acetolactate synthase [Clostridium pasteurianum]ELP60300.1 acetolactate synthase small subunit [Clostridium pasteurianum DSM 525 = ATCC 6013]
MKYNENYVIELIVNNHPGVMSHIVGLFSRRAFNLEGILCLRIDEGNTSRMYLLVKNDDRTEQILKQLEKLYDVIRVSLHTEEECPVFNTLH